MNFFNFNHLIKPTQNILWSKPRNHTLSSLTYSKLSLSQKFKRTPQHLLRLTIINTGIIATFFYLVTLREVCISVSPCVSYDYCNNVCDYSPPKYQELFLVQEPIIMGFSFQSKKPQVNTTLISLLPVQITSLLQATPSKTDAKPENHLKFHQSKLFNLRSWTDK